MSELSHNVVLCLALLKNSALSYHSCLSTSFCSYLSSSFSPSFSLSACHLFCASFGHNAIGLPFTNQLTLLSPSAFLSLSSLSLPAPSNCHCVFAFIIFLYSYLFFFVFFFSFNFTCFFLSTFNSFWLFLIFKQSCQLSLWFCRPTQPIDMQFVAQL